jgi:hypothetical protein
MRGTTDHLAILLAPGMASSSALCSNPHKYTEETKGLTRQMCNGGNAFSDGPRYSPGVKWFGLPMKRATGRASPDVRGHHPTRLRRPEGRATTQYYYSLLKEDITYEYSIWLSAWI